MAFQTPPTFVDGAVLSASQLNILGENQNYLSDIAAGVNVGFPQVSLGDDQSQSYHVVHSHNNLYIRAHLTYKAVIDIYYDHGNGNERVYTHVGAAGGELVTANEDISGYGIPLGARCTVEVACAVSGGGGPPTLTLYYLTESAAEL
jgi:hypothetical protein